MRYRILSLAVGIASSVMFANAHHSIAGAYDTNRQVTVEGIVLEFHFVNPHPFLTVQVKTGREAAQQWRVEMDNRSELSEVGMTKETLKPGERIVVMGNPANAQKQSLYIRQLDRPRDGFRYEQVGSSPRINFVPR